MSAWSENIQQVRDSMIALKAELKASEPKDRLDSIAKVLQCIDFLRNSNIGWASFLSNPAVANQLDEEALKDIAARFTKMATERIDSDVDCINRYLFNVARRSG